MDTSGAESVACAIKIGGKTVTPHDHIVFDSTSCKSTEGTKITKASDATSAPLGEVTCIDINIGLTFF
tara:strand:- start:372 stop:575 length:204 start_codon:yes stop_codon:yes gene_type:complete